jgi:hypothetical protein
MNILIIKIHKRVEEEEGNLEEENPKNPKEEEECLEEDKCKILFIIIIIYNVRK